MQQDQSIPLSERAQAALPSLSSAAGVDQVAPPPNNMGVQNTWLVDWLAFTCSPGCSLNDAVDWLIPLAELQPAERGNMGYRQQLVGCDGGFRLYFDGQPSMGPHVVISATGLRFLEATGRVADWKDVISKLIANGWHLTRFDVAIDDREGLVSREKIETAIADRTVVSRFRVGKWESGFSLQTGIDESAGWTVYFGSPTSDTLVRAYDKAAEQGESGHWIRVEFQLRDKQAQALAMVWLMGTGDQVLEVLMGYLSFREAGADSNRSRWAVASWWLQLLGVVRGRPLRAERVERTIDQVKQWLVRQVSPLLAVVVEADAGDLSWLSRMLDEGRNRWRPPHRQLLHGAMQPAG